MSKCYVMYFVLFIRKHFSAVQKHETLLGQIFGFLSSFGISGWVYICPHKGWGHERRLKRQVVLVQKRQLPSKILADQDLFDGSDSAANWTEWRSAAAAPEWFGSGLITQADDSSDNWSDNSIELMMFGDFLRCPWPTYLLHLTLNQCWMTSPATPNHAVGFQLTRCWVLLSHSDWGSRYWIW